MADPPRRRARRALLVVAALASLLVLGLAGLWGSLPDPRPLARQPPATTALIEQRREEARQARRPFRAEQAWVPLERISPRLVTAVVASEDATFFDHRGFDWAALRDAARHDLARGRFVRGASTITQQLAKNLWLGTHKSLWRKAREAVGTAKLERALDKRRLLALYLNVAEWGDGTFGVEAGSRRHLGVGAGQLTTAQAVLLASMLPAPRRVDLAHPSPWLRERATHLLDRLHDEHAIPDEEHRAARAELSRLLGGPAPAPANTPAEPPEDDEPPAPPPAAAAGDAEPAPAPAQEPAATQVAPAPLAPPAEPAPEPASVPAQGAGGTTGQAVSAPPEQVPPPHE